MTETTEKAGAIILSNKDKNNVALLHRSKQDDWSFPKGHVDPGENSTETMLREIKEETGLSVSILQTLPDLEYIHSSGKKISTKMFLVQSEDDSLLKIEFEGDEIQWVQCSNVINKLSYDNLKDYFEKTLLTVEKFIISE